MPPTRTAAWIAAGTAMLMLAEHIAAKATRDALFLSVHGIGALPTVIVVSAVASLAIVPLVARLLTRWGPARLVPPAFAVSAALLVFVWVLTQTVPSAAAITLYMHHIAINAVLISWFWSLVNERFDPRTARKEMRRMVGGATLGGLVGGLIAERSAVWLGVSPMLLVLAAMHLLCAAAALSLGRGAPTATATIDTPVRALAFLRKSTYARDLAALVLFSTVAATMVDFVFKSGAAAAYDRGPALLRFFAVFYTLSGLATFLVQALFGHAALTRLGIAPTVASLPAAVIAGSVGALAVPGLPSAAVVRGAEAALHSSLFRSGYELFFMPLPPGEKRSIKTVIDVGFDRLGDASGGVLVALLLALFAPSPRAALLVAAIVLSLGVVVLTVRLHRGYRRSLEHNLRARAVELDLDDVRDSTTMSVLRSLGDSVRLPSMQRAAVAPPPAEPTSSPPVDPLMERIAALRCGDAARARPALEGEPLPISLVPHVIPLLAWDEVAPAALAALRPLAGEVVGQLVDSLLSPTEEFAVRRRVPRLLEVAGGRRAVDGLLRGLEDSRFEVRYRCGRALARIQARSPGEQLDRERILAAVLREARLGRGVWESQRLLDADEPEPGDSTDPESEFVDEVVRERASRSLEHVFTVLSLAFPRRPLVIAFRGLLTDDATLRGTALEYLETALPQEIRTALWPYLEDDRRPAQRTTRPREQVLEELLVSNRSIQINLELLRKLNRG